MKGYKHGFYGTHFYRKWASMISRCENPSQESYRLYGGRGIKVAARWLIFLNFKEDMYASYLSHVKEHGEKDTTLERKNVQKDYCLENCVWATVSEQARNRRSSKMLTYAGITMSMPDMADAFGLTYDQLKLRLRRGWSLEKSLQTPRLINQHI